jgi:hypothetical protein
MPLNWRCGKTEEPVDCVVWKLVKETLQCNPSAALVPELATWYEKESGTVPTVCQTVELSGVQIAIGQGLHRKAWNSQTQSMDINGPLFRSFLRWFANDFHPVGMSQRKSQGPNPERVFRLPHKLSGSSHFPLRNGCPRGCFGLLQSLGCAQTTARWERTSNSQWTLGPCYVSLTPGVLLEIQSL